MPRYSTARSYVYRLFDVGSGGRLGYYIDACILVLIIGNVLTVMPETIEPVYTAYGSEFYGFEVVSVVVFSIEYGGRLWAATEHPEYDHWFWGRLRFALSPYMLIDFLAIVPFFLTTIVDLRVLGFSDSFGFFDCSSSLAMTIHYSCSRL